MEIINQILSWPIIVQGALGSALFWLFLIIGQYITNKSKKLIGAHKEDMLARDKIIEQVIKSNNFNEITN